MLNNFLDNHFLHRINKHHSVFMRSDIRLNDRRSARISSKTYPGIIISYDAKHSTPFGTALFEKENAFACDIHDAAIEDIVKLDSALDLTLQSLNQFVDDP